MTKKEGFNLKKTLKNNAGFIALLFVIFIVKSSIADWNTVPSGSMRPTLLDGDQIFINKLAYDIKVPLTKISLATLGEPERGDIVVFDSEVRDLRMVKRVIGLPDDDIMIVNNVLFINGIKATYAPSTLSEKDKHSLDELDQAAVEFYNGYEVDSSGLSFDYKTEEILGMSNSLRIEHGIKSKGKPVDEVKDYVGLIPKDRFLVIGDNRNNSNDSRFWGFVKRDEIVGRTKHVVMSFNTENYYLPRSERFFKKIN